MTCPVSIEVSGKQAATEYDAPPQPPLLYASVSMVLAWMQYYWPDDVDLEQPCSR